MFAVNAARVMHLNSIRLCGDVAIVEVIVSGSRATRKQSRPRAGLRL
jgi:hypothetical protein